MTLRPCLRCGEPTPRTHCDEHRPKPSPKSPRDFGYDAAWDRLSRRARRLQPWCSACGAVDDLTADHRPAAWEAKAAGRAITIAMVDVLCRSCNTRRGAARGNALTRGYALQEVKEALAPKPQSALHTGLVQGFQLAAEITPDQYRGERARGCQPEQESGVSHVGGKSADAGRVDNYMDYGPHKWDQTGEGERTDFDSAAKRSDNPASRCKAGLSNPQEEREEGKVKLKTGTCVHHAGILS